MNAAQIDNVICSIKNILRSQVVGPFVVSFALGGAWLLALMGGVWLFSYLMPGVLLPEIVIALLIIVFVVVMPLTFWGALYRYTQQ